MESLKFVGGKGGGNFRDLWFFVYLQECNFVNASIFSFSKKTFPNFYFVEDVNSWERDTHGHQEN